MQHLDSERLAAFDHEPFTAEELAHLAVCVSCRTERDEYAQLVAMVGSLAFEATVDDGRRLVSWESIAAGLREAPVPHHDIAPPRSVTSHVSATPWWGRSSLRMAAAVALMAGGAALGRLSVTTVSIAAGSGDTLVAAVAEFASVGQATDVLTRAQREYERASLWLAANDSTPHDSDVYRARLAALDQMMAASRAALRDAPQDPVLNQYYLAAFSAREATLQQLGITLPVDKSIERY